MNEQYFISLFEGKDYMFVVISEIRKLINNSFPDTTDKKIITNVMDMAISKNIAHGSDYEAKARATAKIVKYMAVKTRRLGLSNKINRNAAEVFIHSLELMMDRNIKKELFKD